MNIPNLKDVNLWIIQVKLILFKKHRLSDVMPQTL